jgi:hypothetical protein
MMCRFIALLTLIFLPLLFITCQVSEHKPTGVPAPRADFTATLFVKTWGGGREDSLSGIAVDSSGNIYCAGYTKSFGAGGYDALLLKYDSSGALQWARTWGGTNDDHLHAVVLDSDGNMMGFF